MENAGKPELNSPQICFTHQSGENVGSEIPRRGNRGTKEWNRRRRWRRLCLISQQCERGGERRRKSTYRREMVNPGGRETFARHCCCLFFLFFFFSVCLVFFPQLRSEELLMVKMREIEGRREGGKEKMSGAKGPFLVYRNGDSPTDEIDCVHSSVIAKYSVSLILFFH
ncbi:hypothetical protein CRG98_010026 [Punica granatum]|uniref:Transmembrane protein n=1 Tax=Punica granatum TaxID=22663 RepID=A0A2I0KM74_PUNGR|nr:hypothetical protein CRG98_010026 [Punica granatum]